MTELADECPICQDTGEVPVEARGKHSVRTWECNLFSIDGPDRYSCPACERGKELARAIKNEESEESADKVRSYAGDIRYHQREG